MSRKQSIVSWTLQIIAVTILFQTLFFKFTGAPESVHIFTILGMEPWGRIGSGVVELIACMLLLAPRFVFAGAGLALGVITGAIGSHLAKLGIVVQNDGGLLFTLACVVFACCSTILWLRRNEGMRMLKSFRAAKQ